MSAAPPPPAAATTTTNSHWHLPRSQRDVHRALRVVVAGQRDSFIVVVVSFLL